MLNCRALTVLSTCQTACLPNAPCKTTARKRGAYIFTIPLSSEFSAVTFKCHLVSATSARPGASVLKFCPRCNCRMHARHPACTENGARNNYSTPQTLTATGEHSRYVYPISPRLKSLTSYVTLRFPSPFLDRKRTTIISG